MPTLAPGVVTRSADPKLMVENKLDAGSWRFRLTVVGASGLESEPIELRVQVVPSTRPRTGPQLCVGDSGVTSDLDIWRAAQLMVKRHGEDAAIHAGMRADELLAEGDVDGAATWRAIIRAIEELQRTALREGEPINQSSRLTNLRAAGASGDRE